MAEAYGTARAVLQERREQRVLRDGRWVSDIAPPHVHGRASGYQSWSCRCQKCTDWSADRHRESHEIWIHNQRIIDRLNGKRPAPQTPCVEAPAPSRLEPVVEKVEPPKPAKPKPVEPKSQPVELPVAIGQADWKFEPSLVPPLIPAVRDRVKSVEDIERIAKAYHQPDWSSPGGPEGRERRVSGTTQIIVATDGNVIFWNERREVASGESELLTAAPKALPKAKGGGEGSRVPTTTKDLIAMFKKIGCEVEHTGSGHLRVSRDGKSIIMPSTPTDWRSLANTIGQARRNGLM